MNKKLIRLTESDLHKIVKSSVKRIVKENLYRNKNGKLIWEPAEETKYSIGPEGPNGWPNLLNKDDRSETGYQIYGWEELPDDKRRYSVWNSIARNSEDFIPEQKMHKIVKESVNRVLKEGVEFSSEDPQEEWMYYQNKLQQEFDELGVMVLNKIPRNDPDRQIIQRYIRMIQTHLHTLEN